VLRPKRFRPRPIGWNSDNFKELNMYVNVGVGYKNLLYDSMCAADNKTHGGIFYLFNYNHLANTY